MPIQRFLPILAFSVFLLGSCTKEAPLDQEELTESREEAAAEKQLAVGKSIYETNCAGCHDSDVAGAPTPGDKSDWKNRIPQGVTILAKKAIEGYDGKKGMMPPKGGNDVLTDEEVTSAVKYMISRTK
ncbi:MAG: c-type cytochrome [Chlorobiaceae bacterium]